MNPKILLKTEDNKEIECEIIAKWKEKNMDFIAYTDGVKEDGLDVFYMAKVISSNGIVKIADLSPEEMISAQKYMDENYFNSEEFDE